MKSDEAAYHGLEDVPLWVALKAPDALAEVLGKSVETRPSAWDDSPDNVISMFRFRARLSYELPASMVSEAGSTVATRNKRRGN